MFTKEELIEIQRYVFTEDGYMRFGSVRSMKLAGNRIRIEHKNTGYASISTYYFEYLGELVYLCAKVTMIKSSRFNL